jgi:type IV secretion system protein VirB1
MVLAMVLAQLLHDCASNVAPRTMAAVVRVESSGNPLAMHDNTLGRSFYPTSYFEAASWANELVAMGHSVDIGLSQINSANLPKLGLTVASAFDPCTNLHAGATILGGDYAAAASTFGPGQTALRRALGAYNTGSLYAGQGYINQILAAAGIAPDAGQASAPADPVVVSSSAHRAAAARPTSNSLVVYGVRPSYEIHHETGSVEVIESSP